MPLTNDVIIQLNEISAFVQDKANPSNTELEKIKSIFRSILQSGQQYNVEEIESWFENEGSWHDHNVRTRITNISHYVQSRYEQQDKLKMLSEDSCSCDN